MSHRISHRDGSPDQSKRHARVELDNSGRTLRAARRAARLSQKQLAARVGVDHSFISLIESGERPIRSVGYRTVVRIALALNNKAEDLFPVVLPDEAQRTA